MKKLLLITLLLLCSNIVMAVSPVQDGNWNDTNTWGGSIPAVGALIIPDIYFITIPDGYTNPATGRLQMSAGGVFVEGSGTLEVGNDLWFNVTFDTTSENFIITDSNRIRILNNGNNVTWTHNGDLTFATRYMDIDLGNNKSQTLAGTGTLTLPYIKWWVNGALLTVDRNLTVGSMTNDNPSAENYTLRLNSGTTTVNNALFDLGNFSGFETKIDFNSTTPTLLVNTNSYTIADAQSDITNGYLTAFSTTTALSWFDLSTLEISGTNYTQIKKFISGRTFPDALGTDDILQMQQGL